MIRTLFATICLAIITVLAGPPLLLYVALTGSVTPLYRAGVAAALWASRVAGMRIRAVDVKNIPAGPCLFAANHTSNADPPAIVGATPRRIAVMAKKSLFSIPIVGTAFRMSAYVPVDRGNPERAAASVDVAVEHMRQGVSYLVYPEGTRSRSGRLLPFRKGAFALAIKAGVPVVPVACIGAHRVLPKNAFRIRPGEVTVKFCPAIDAREYSLDRRGELAERVHAAIAAALPPDQQPEQQPDQQQGAKAKLVPNEPA
jgi:1-acyl-sn-glycerol-3-phosphate acyltransferase